MSCLITTVVLECILQAADVAHMMQHWQTYTKFNQKLHAERLAARDQVSDDTVSHSTTVELWYQGELNFFDSTVLPLTVRLQHCGVLFGSWEQNPDMGNLWGFYRLHGYYFGDPYISGLAL